MGWYRRLRNLTRRGRIDLDIDRELSFHIAERIDDLVASGRSEEEARRMAMRQFGNYTLQKERTRDMRIPQWIESFGQDLQYAVRTYLRSPGFTAVAVLSLALGIGANVAVFSLLDTVLLRKLPVHNPDELVSVGFRGGLISFPMYRDMRERQDVFTDLLASATVVQRITIPSDNAVAAELDNMMVGTVSAAFFDVLGLQPAAGRFFTPEDDRIPNSSETAGSVVVLSDSLWERQFGRDPRVLGRTVLIGRSRCRIIGVAPPGFFGVTVGSAPVAWVPLVPFNDAPNLENRRGVFTNYMARLKPGMTHEQAQARMTVLFRQLLKAEGLTRTVDNGQILLNPGNTGIDSNLRRTYTRPLWIVMGIVLLVHMIACANLANLLLARVAARRSEIGVRLAIGCSRARLIRQLLTESVLLSMLGGAAGVVLAYWGSEALVRMINFGSEPPLQLDMGADWRTLSFLATMAVLTAAGFGLAPALRAARGDLAPAINGGGRSDAAGARRQRLSRVLVGSQVALSLLLVITAGLLIQTIYNLHRLDKGFQTESVILFDLAYNTTQRPATASLLQAARAVPERIQQIPGVESTNVAAPVYLFSGAEWFRSLLIPEFSSERVAARYMSVSPGYLEMLGITLRQGRSIEERDGENAPLVAVINESMARQFFPGGAVGRIMQSISGPPPPAPPSRPGPPIEVIGVVRDSKYNNLREEETKPLFYVPIRQLPLPLRSLQVRTREPLASITTSVRQALLEVDKDLMVRRAVALSDQVVQSFGAERMIMRLCVFFGVLALLLACIGLYGIMSYAVAQRTGEIGIRMALGATGRSVLKLVLGESFTVVLAGIVIGLPIAWASTRLVATFLFGVTATDPVTIVLATLLLLATAALAAFLPARRASRVDPMIALRHE